MEQNQLDEIRERCDAATPASWRVGDGNEKDLWNGENVVIIDGRVICQRSICNSIYEKQTYADIKFIAHAREDIPALLDEVERLKSEYDAVISDFENCGSGMCNTEFCNYCKYQKDRRFCIKYGFTWRRLKETGM
jgi:hypothetical protein